MLPNQISRSQLIKTVSIANGEAVSGAVQMADFAGGMVLMPSTWTAANLGFKVSLMTGSYYPLRDQSGALVQITGIQTGALGAYPLPDELFGCQLFEFWSCDAAGADVNQGGARSITAVLKG